MQRAARAWQMALTTSRPLIRVPTPSTLQSFFNEVYFAIKPVY